MPRKKRFLLTDRLKAFRLERSKKLLHKLKKKTPTFLFSLEEYFIVDPTCNNRTDHFITKKNAKEVPNTIRSFQKSLYPIQAMIFRLITSSGEKMPLVFIKTNLRMGAKEYLNQVLKAHVFSRIVATFPDPQKFSLFKITLPVIRKRLETCLRILHNFFAKAYFATLFA